MDINSVRCICYIISRSIVSMGSVAKFMIVLIMKLMPQIKVCVIYKYENRYITYIIKHDDRNDMHIKWTV